MKVAVIGATVCESMLTASEECHCVITGFFAEESGIQPFRSCQSMEFMSWYITEGTVDGKNLDFIKDYLLPILLPFNVNPYSVVIMDNASIHHVCEVEDLIVNQAGARLCYLPPYSPDLMPAERVFSQIKSIMKENHRLFQVCSAPRVLLAMAFGMVSVENCYGHISRCGYI